MNSRRHDPDVKTMTIGQLRRAVMKLRRKIRWHRDLTDNARCWHCDNELCSVLPEGKPAGRMTGSEEYLFGNCKRYIRRQQCWLHGCTGIPYQQRRMIMSDESPKVCGTCRVCNGNIVEKIETRFDPRMGPAIIGPGGNKQYETVSAGYYCTQCGLKYEFVKPPTGEQERATDE